MEDAADRPDQPEVLQQPDDDPDNDDDADDLLDRPIHRDQFDQVQQQPDHNERDNNTDNAGREHTKRSPVLLGCRKTPTLSRIYRKSFAPGRAAGCARRSEPRQAPYTGSTVDGSRRQKRPRGFPSRKTALRRATSRTRLL